MHRSLLGRVRLSTPTYQSTSFSYDPARTKTPSTRTNTIHPTSSASPGQRPLLGMLVGVSCAGGVFAAIAVVVLIWLLRKHHSSSCRSKRQEDSIPTQKRMKHGRMDIPVYATTEHSLAEVACSAPSTSIPEPETTTVSRTPGSDSWESDHFSGYLPLGVISNASPERDNDVQRPLSTSSSQNLHSYTMTNPDIREANHAANAPKYTSGSLLQLVHPSSSFVAPNNPHQVYRTPGRLPFASPTTCPIYTPSQYGEPPSSIQGPGFTRTRTPPSLPQQYSTISLGSTADMYIGWDRNCGSAGIFDMQLRQKELTHKEND